MELHLHWYEEGELSDDQLESRRAEGERLTAALSTLRRRALFTRLAESRRVRESGGYARWFENSIGEKNG